MSLRYYRVAIVSLMLLGGCSDTTPVPKTQNDKLILASRIAAIQFNTPAMDAFMASMEAKIRAIPSEYCNSMPPEKLSECLEAVAPNKPLMDETVQNMIAMAKDARFEFRNQMATTLTSVYSGEELALLVDFYESPAFKLNAEHQAEVSKLFYANAMKAMQPEFDRATAKLQDVVASRSTTAK